MFGPVPPSHDDACGHAMTDWKQSTGHLAVLNAAQANLIGIGVYYRQRAGGNLIIYWCVIFGYSAAHESSSSSSSAAAAAAAPAPR